MTVALLGAAFVFATSQFLLPQSPQRGTIALDVTPTPGHSTTPTTSPQPANPTPAIVADPATHGGTDSGAHAGSPARHRHLLRAPHARADRGADPGTHAHSNPDGQAAADNSALGEPVAVRHAAPTAAPIPSP